MRFVELTEYFQELEKTRSRNVITEMVAQVLKEVSPEEVDKVAYLLMGELGPLYNRVDFALADKMIMRAMALAYTVDLNEVLKRFKEEGDLGLVAHSLSINHRVLRYESITITEIYEKLMLIARDSGAGSQDRKVQSLATLLTLVRPEEAKYVVRIVLGRLRLGFSDKTLLDALSVMERGSKDGREALEQAYQVMPDIGTIARLVKAYGIEGIEMRVSVTMGVPVMPALCQRLRTAEDMIKKMGEVMVEPKFDGTRVQIHMSKLRDEWQVKTFTRNLEETTAMFPELPKALTQIKADEVILDSEAVGIHPQTGKMLPFQMTITRKRKHGVDEAAINVPLKFFVFDVLYKDGQSMIHVPLLKRREILEHIIKPGPVLTLDEKIVTHDSDTLRNYHSQKLADGLEGVVVKQINSPYEPGRRGWSWVKFKEAETSNGKLSDTIDAVVMGFYRGQGKRSAFGIGAFLVGIRSHIPSGNGQDPAIVENPIVTVAKIGTGLSDTQWKELRKRLEESVSLEKPVTYVVDKGLIPDVWAEPKVIVEIAADEVTNSPNHSAGYALRFPRLVKFRDDKNLETITSIEELLAIKGN